MVGCLLAASVVGCGSSQHASIASSTQTTTSTGTATTAAFARVAATSDAAQYSYTLSVSRTARSVQLADGACNFEVEGSRSATITGASVTVIDPSVPVRVTSIHVSSRYASVDTADDHALVGIGAYRSARFRKPPSIFAGFRAARGVQLKPGFYNVTVESTIKIGNAYEVSVPAVILHLRSGADQTTLVCPAQLTLKKVK